MIGANVPRHAGDVCEVGEIRQEGLRSAHARNGTQFAGHTVELFPASPVKQQRVPGGCEPTGGFQPDAVCRTGDEEGLGHGVWRPLWRLRALTTVSRQRICSRTFECASTHKKGL